MNREEILSGFAFFSRLSPSHRARLIEEVRVATLPAGTSLYREGDTGGDLGLVIRGRIRVFKISASGRQITLYNVRDGEACLVNMLSVFLGRPAMADARTEVETMAAVLPSAVCRSLFAESVPLRDFVFESMGTRLIEVMHLTEEVVFRRMDVRLGEFITRRFANEGRPLREITVTHDEIAAELGTAREVVSRLLKEFENSGAVLLSRGRIELLNPEFFPRD